MQHSHTKRGLSILSLLTSVAIYAIHQFYTYTASHGGKDCTGKKETCAAS
jgi:hypothetical protein